MVGGGERDRDSREAPTGETLRFFNWLFSPAERPQKYRPFKRRPASPGRTSPPLRPIGHEGIPEDFGDDDGHGYRPPNPSIPISKCAWPPPLKPTTPPPSSSVR